MGGMGSSTKAADFNVIDYNGTYAIAGSGTNDMDGNTNIFYSTDDGVNCRKHQFQLGRTSRSRRAHHAQRRL